MKPDFDPRPVVLEGTAVRLEPLAETHAADLLAAGGDDETWLYMPIPALKSIDDALAMIRDALVEAREGREVPFAVIERSSGRAVGSTRYLDLQRPHRALEIGWTWIGPAWRRTAVNTECKALLLRHAFEELGAHRVTLKTDARNLRSQRAIERIGGWRTDLGKVDNTLIAGEDHELCVRLFLAGLYSGIYDPTVSVRHLVPASRLTRRYFRRWFYWHGRTMARMADAVYLDLDLTRVPSIAGVPRFVYREFLQQGLRWLGRIGRSDGLALLIEEVKLVEYVGFFSETWRSRLTSRRSLGQGAVAATQDTRATHATHECSR